MKLIWHNEVYPDIIIANIPVVAHAINLKHPLTRAGVSYKGAVITNASYTKQMKLSIAHVPTTQENAPPV